MLVLHGKNLSFRELLISSLKKHLGADAVGKFVLVCWLGARAQDIKTCPDAPGFFQVVIFRVHII